MQRSTEDSCCTVCVNELRYNALLYYYKLFVIDQTTNEQKGVLGDDKSQSVKTDPSYFATQKKR